MFGWSKFQSRTAVGAVGALVVGFVGVLAVQDPGYAAQNVHLDQQDVWVTNESELLIGRINHQIDELDSAVKVSAMPFDVFQNGDTVIALDGSKHELRPIDAASVTMAGRISLPADPAVAFGGGVLAVADEATGAIWVGTPTELTGLDPAADEPTVTTAPGVAVTVSAQGTVFAAAPGSDTLWTISAAAGPSDESSQTSASATAPASTAAPTSGAPPSEGGAAAAGAATVAKTRIAGGALSDATVGARSADAGPTAAPDTGQPAGISLTAVGETPVILDAGADRLVLPRVSVDLKGARGPVLQQAGAAADSVVVATSTGLMGLSLTDGKRMDLVDGRSGRPAAPVNLDGCVHGAWSGATADAPASYAMACAGAPAQVRPIPGQQGPATLTFRVNGDVIVLNDVVSGTAWTADADLTVINNWDQVKPLSDDDTPQENSGTEGSAAQATTTRTNCTPGKTDPPTAVDDDFGVRAGRTTVLQVLANDASSGCSVIAISGIDPWTDDDGAAVDVVESGRALQVSVPQGVTGALPPITYTATDGLGRSARAQVAVTVVADDVHEPPTKLRDSSVPVETLGTVSYNVLANYVSPNGDDLFLVGASMDEADVGDEVTFQPDGLITYYDKGVGGAVKKTVHFEVSDGYNAPVAGSLSVDVRPDGAAEPIAAPVYARGVVNRPMSVNILDSVTAPSVDPTLLTTVAAFDKADQKMVGALDQSAGTVSLTAPAPGTYYFNYTVAAGDKTAEGLLRVDVTTPSPDAKPPVTMQDVVYLPADGVVTLDPTVNDTDPMAAGLAVTQVRPDSAISATVEGMQVVTISARGVLHGEAATIGYTVSNGAAEADGTIRVVPVPETAAVPPIAHDIDATVRAADAITIPIAEHAVDRGGEVITLTGLGTDGVPGNSGVLFGTDTAIRYLAPKAPLAKPLRFSYTVTNTSGASATGLVTLRVVGPPAKDHAPAEPQPVLARVFTGQRVTIPLPLSGIDPDDDWVTVDGITAPSTHPLGSPTVSGLSAIDYTAGDTPGYDAFGYQAADPYGATTTGQVAVLVVAPPDTVQAPTAPNLTVTARPDRTVAIDVISPAATVNPAERISLAGHPFDAPAGWRITVDKGTSLVLHTPKQDVTESIKYTVVNGAGLTGSGIITLTVSATAPIKPPTAKDIVVDPTALKPGQTSVDVTIPNDILTNPGGTVADLKLTLAGQSGAAATVTGDRTIRVPLTKARQVLAYRVTNADKDSATAFIVLPSQATVNRAASPLSAQFTGKPLTVKAGERLTIDVPANVTAADSLRLTVPNGAEPTVTGGGDVARLDDAHVIYAAPKDGDGRVFVAVPVTDGARPAVTVSIPVTVIPAVVPAPVVKDAAIDVEAGKSVSQDIARLVTAGDAEQQGKLRYEITGGGSGFTVSLSGSTLTVAAAANARGTTATLTLTATDRQGTPKSGTGTITVTATGSTAPLLKADAITIDEGRPNVAASVNVLGAVTYNPFAAPPTVVDATVTSGKGRVSAPGPRLQVTPTAVGTVVVTAALRDATQDPSRDVPLTITVIVKDKPAKPGTPTAVSMQAHQVEIAWTPPDANGSPITGYTVSDAAQHFSQRCTASPCTLTGLTSGTEYRFAVVATNAVGPSEPSESSAPVTPDTAPNIPAPPTVTWLAGQQALQVNWKNPGSDGTPVDRYDLAISPADSQGRTSVSVTGTGYVWEGLAYGQAYTFTVQAHNQAKTASGYSQASNAETPSTAASAPTGLDVTFGVGQYSAQGNTLTATWATPANDGGAALTGYQVRVSPAIGGQSAFDVGAGTNSQVLQHATDGTTYSVTVAAKNRSGLGAASATKTVTPYSKPDAVTSVSATASGANGTVNLSWSPASGHGRAISSYTITVSDGGASTTAGASATSKAITGLSNGTTYTFTVSACYSDNTCGGSASGSASPYGPVGAPVSVTATPAQTSVAFSWANPPSNGRGPMTSQWSTNGTSGWTTGTSHAVAAACGGTTATLWIRGADGAGHFSGATAISGKTTACAATEWPVTVTTDTCPENRTTSHWNGRTCTSNDGAGHSGFINRGTSLVVVCSYYWPGTQSVNWYRIASSSPIYAGWYVARGDTNVTSNPAGMPTC